MCFMISLIPATFWTAIGFFILFTSEKAEGRLKLFGRILAVWIFVIAVGVIICGIYMTASGLCPLNKLMGIAG